MLCILMASGPMTAAAAPLTDGEAELLADGFEFTEGPVWLPSGELVFSDIPADTIFRLDKSVFRRPSGKSNGLTLDPEGRLVACEHWNRRVTRTAADGAIEVLAEQYDGKKLNSPNDVVVRSDGTVFFTDPPYGLEGREAELDMHGVFAIRPDGTLVLLADDFVRPNGLTFSPDESILYIADTELGHLRAFDVAEDGALTNGHEFCRLERPDGIKTDEAGRLWCATADGVQVFGPGGHLLETIALPQRPANLAFGGEDGRSLFVTARTGVYLIRTKEKGILPGRTR